jgi:hypothetical protein
MAVVLHIRDCAIPVGSMCLIDFLLGKLTPSHHLLRFSSLLNHILESTCTRI